MNKLTRVSLVAVAPLFALFAAPVEAGQLAPGLYAMMQTSKGDILLELFYQDTPMTVANFVGLAEGTIDNSAKQPGQPYYDGIVFHRVIADFMIQGGDPTGTGRSGPGYNYADEFRPHLRHNAPGILSMANAGPGTNGSQFFITHVPTPHLDDHHTVFGKVVSGQNVVDAIRQGDSITKLTIIRVGPEAERFVVDTETFQRLQEENASGGAKAVSRAPAAATESAPTSDADYGKLIRRYQKEAKTSRTGLKYVILKEGEGNPPREGQTIQAEYTGRFMDGRVFDSSLGRQPLSVKVGKGQVIAGWDEALSLMKVGEKRALIIPSKLAYGKQGMGGVIPPDATLFFEVERVK